jgi:hypothetical protein
MSPVSAVGEEEREQADLHTYRGSVCVNAGVTVHVGVSVALKCETFARQRVARSNFGAAHFWCQVPPTCECAPRPPQRLALPLSK